MDRVIVLDTTLRDGERVPGFSMNTMERLEMARQLARLQVDVIEAGFPISSDGDFEATREVGPPGRHPRGRAGDLRPVPCRTRRHRPVLGSK